MPAETILGGLSKEASLQEMLANATYYLASVLEKMPRVDANDRLLINASEITSPVTVSSGSVTVSSATVSVVQALGLLSRPTDAIPMHMANAGSMHIYDNIKVS